MLIPTLMAQQFGTQYLRHTGWGMPGIKPPIFGHNAELKQLLYEHRTASP